MFCWGVWRNVDCEKVAILFKLLLEFTAREQLQVEKVVVGVCEFDSAFDFEGVAD